MTIKPSQYKILQPFEAWVQQTLPAIYDDSLSYTDLLAKLLYYVNTLAENNTTLSNDMTNAINYINNYFDNLDIQDEINIKLDKMTEDGTLMELIAPFLNTFITPEMYGAKGDGVHDDTEALQQALNQNKAILGINKYLTSSTLVINGNYKNVNITGEIIYSGDNFALNIGGYYNDININKITSDKGNGVIICGGTIETLSNSNITINYMKCDKKCFSFDSGIDKTIEYKYAQYNSINGLQWTSINDSCFNVYIDESAKNRKTWFNSNYIYNVQCKTINSSNYAFNLINAYYHTGTLGQLIDGNSFMNISPEGSTNAFQLDGCTANSFYNIRLDEIEGTQIKLKNICDRNKIINCNLTFSKIINECTEVTQNTIQGIIYTDKASYNYSNMTIGHDSRNTLHPQINQVISFAQIEYNSYTKVTGNRDISNQTLATFDYPTITPYTEVNTSNITLTLSSEIYNTNAVNHFNLKLSGCKNVTVKINEWQHTFNTSGAIYFDSENNIIVNEYPTISNLKITKNINSINQNESVTIETDLSSYIGQCLCVSGYSINNHNCYVSKMIIQNNTLITTIHATSLASEIVIEINVLIEN